MALFGGIEHSRPSSCPACLILLLSWIESQPIGKTFQTVSSDLNAVENGMANVLVRASLLFQQSSSVLHWSYKVVGTCFSLLPSLEESVTKIPVSIKHRTWRPRDWFLSLSHLETLTRPRLWQGCLQSRAYGLTRQFAQIDNSSLLMIAQ